MYNIDQIVKILEPKECFIKDSNRMVSSLLYDSRKILRAHEGVFFALYNLRDGHDFISSAYKNGVRNFVISKDDFNINDYPRANFIKVDNVLVSLQKLASYVRKQFAQPIVGITGSNGKTIVKEWLHELLIPEYKTFQSPKSYNSQLGVALSLWELSEQYDLALIEAGISQQGEMEFLENMIKPSIGIVTGIGPAHAEGFESKECKIKEKLSLFKDSSILIYPSDCFNLDDYLPGKKSFTWGYLSDDNIKILEIAQSKPNVSSVRFLYNETISTVDIPFQDKASVRNILTCITFLLYYGIPLDVILERIHSLRHIEMRLQLKNGKNNCSIIDDSYSNDLGSLKIAIDFLKQQQQHSKKTLVLSDMVGLSHSESLKKKLYRLLFELDLYRLVVVGSELKDLLVNLPYPVFYFRSTQHLLNEIQQLSFEKETILIKGSRKFQLEKFSKLLVEKTHSTVLEINLKAMESNLQIYKREIPENVKIMAMVKALSYGSGSFEIANLLQFNSVDYLAVAYADEGVELRRAGIKLPIMVMNPEPGNFDVFLEYELEPEIYSFHLLEEILDFLKTKNPTYPLPIHIKVDTGMHRLGFIPDEVIALSIILNSNHNVKVVSVFSHLVASDNSKFDEFTTQQIEMFDHFVHNIESLLMYKPIRHIANTGAIGRWPSAYFDMVRLGIGLYGFDSSSKFINLEKVSTLRTTVTQVKKVRKGDSVGYERGVVLDKDTLVATVRIGYADGYDRRFGNGVGCMEIKGSEVFTLGRICMDMCMLDVTGLEVAEGDEVIVFPDVNKAADSIGTIPYELLVNVSSRVKRVYYYE